jgi:hypothetical protein
MTPDALIILALCVFVILVSGSSYLRQHRKR